MSGGAGVSGPKVWLVVGVAAAIAGALAALGLAPAGARVKTNSFEGSCAFKGTVKFTPPATNDQQNLTAEYSGPGTCTGTLNGREISNAPATMKNIARNVDGSCRRAQTRDPGSGSFTFKDGSVVSFQSEFDFLSVVGTLDFRGRSSGTASGTGTFVTDRTPPDVAARCGSEEGVKSTPLDINVSTDSPLKSRQNVGGGGGGGGGQGGDRPGGDGGDDGRKPRHLRLAVKPRNTRAGRHTIFRFRVRTSSGKRKNGAIVRFAGKRARTKRGKARIATTLRRPGRRMARASRPGYGSAKRAVVVR
jgi:hypothetical protein